MTDVNDLFYLKHIMHTLTKKNFELKKVNFNIMHTRSKKSPPRSGYLYCLDLCNTRLTAPR